TATVIDTTTNQPVTAGSVTIDVDGQPAGSADIDPHTGTATVLIQPLAAGSHTLVARYTGSGNLQGSQSDPVPVTVSVVVHVVDLTPAPGVTLEGLKSTPIPPNAPAGASFPLGFFDFTLKGVPAAGATTVQLKLPSGTALNDYWQYGPTPDNHAPHWYDFKYDGHTGADIAHIQGGV